MGKGSSRRVSLVLGEDLKRRSREKKVSLKDVQELEKRRVRVKNFTLRWSTTRMSLLY